MVDKFRALFGWWEKDTNMVALKLDGDDKSTFRETLSVHGPKPNPRANGMFTQQNSNSTPGSPMPQVFMLP